MFEVWKAEWMGWVCPGLVLCDMKTVDCVAVWREGHVMYERRDEVEMSTMRFARDGRKLLTKQGETV